MFDQRGSAAFRSTPAAAGVQQNLRKTLFKCCLLVATFTRVWPCCSYYVLATCTAAWSYYGKTILWSSFHELQCTYTLYFSCFTISFCHVQTADPPLSKATKVARLQLPISLALHRYSELCCWVLWVTHLPLPSFPISRFHFVPGLTSFLSKMGNNRIKTPNFFLYFLWFIVWFFDRIQLHSVFWRLQCNVIIIMLMNKERVPKLHS